MKIYYSDYPGYPQATKISKAASKLSTFCGIAGIIFGMLAIAGGGRDILTGILIIGAAAALVWMINHFANQKIEQIIKQNTTTGSYSPEYDDYVTDENEDDDDDDDSILDEVAEEAFNSLGIPDQIRKLKELADEGILTEEEFEEKKKELLKRI